MPDSSKEKILNVMMENSIEYHDLSCSDNGITFSIRSGNYRPLCFLCSKYNIEIKKISEKGLKHLIFRYRRRSGILIGAVLFAVLTELSTMFIWSIDIKEPAYGYADPAEIRRQLENAGCREGAFIPDIDFHELSNRMVLENDDIAWISVNLNGTCAEVEILPKIPKPEIPDMNVPSNMIASRDGYIESVEVYSGEAAVKTGDTVKKGQLLISGVAGSSGILYEDTIGPYHLVRAAGKVMAVTSYEFSCRQNYKITETLPTGRAYEKKTLNVFGKSIKLYINDEILFEKYDKIVSGRAVDILGKIFLPVSVITERYEELHQVQQELTGEQAENMCIQKAEEKIADICRGGELLSEHIETSHRDGGCESEVKIYVSENIASERRFR